MQIVNEKQEGDNPYITGYKNQKVGLYANSLYAARVKAEAHFKPTKKDAGLLWVELAEED